MAYVDPETIGAYGAGRTRWEPLEIVYSGGEGRWSVAEGTYAGRPRLGIRYNGDSSDRRRGYPTGYQGRPVWFIMPSEMEEVVRDKAKLMVLWNRGRD